MSVKYPIPPCWAHAFGEMVLRYAAGDWTPDGPDNLRVSIGREAYDYVSACRMIEEYGDTLREDSLCLLSAQIHHGDEDLKEDLANKRSYSSAARALRLLLERRKERYRRLEEIRGQRG